MSTFLIICIIFCCICIILNILCAIILIYADKYKNEPIDIENDKVMYFYKTNKQYWTDETTKISYLIKLTIPENKNEYIELINMELDFYRSILPNVLEQDKEHYVNYINYISNTVLPAYIKQDN